MMNESPKIRILLADDHCVVRMGLIELLHLQPDLSVVAEAESADTAVEAYRQHLPDLAILDVRMAGGGIQAAQRILKEWSAARVLMLSSFDYEEDICAAMRAGVYGYVLKTISPTELALAIRKISAGQRYIPADISMRMAERLSTKILSDREVEVLTLLAKGMSNKEIGIVLGVSSFTAKAHVQHIIAKLQVGSRTEAATVAINRGLLKNY